MTYSIQELRTVPDEELIRLHDAKAKTTEAGVQYYLDELARRDNNRQFEHMLKLTKVITLLTVIITVLTIANVILVAIALKNKYPPQ